MELNLNPNVSSKTITDIIAQYEAKKTQMTSEGQNVDQSQRVVQAQNVDQSQNVVQGQSEESIITKDIKELEGKLKKREEAKKEERLKSKQEQKDAQQTGEVGRFCESKNEDPVECDKKYLCYYDRKESKCKSAVESKEIVDITIIQLKKLQNLINRELNDPKIKGNKKLIRMLKKTTIHINKSIKDLEEQRQRFNTTFNICNLIINDVNKHQDNIVNKNIKLAKIFDLLEDLKDTKDPKKKSTLIQDIKAKITEIQFSEIQRKVNEILTQNGKPAIDFLSIGVGKEKKKKNIIY